MWPRLVILLALTFPAELLATKIARVSIDALANEADRIALITLTAGELAKADNDCGVLYRGVVVDPVKNLQTGQTIAFFSRFDDQSGLKIGQQFIVFLNKLDVRSPCRGADLELAHAGFSAFWVGTPYRTLAPNELPRFRRASLLCLSGFVDSRVILRTWKSARQSGLMVTIY